MGSHCECSGQVSTSCEIPDSAEISLADFLRSALRQIRSKVRITTETDIGSTLNTNKCNLVIVHMLTEATRQQSTKIIQNDRSDSDHVK